MSEFFGNYTDYLDEKAFLIQEEKSISHKSENNKFEKSKTEKKRMSYFEKQEWATIEDDITSLEDEINQIEADMQTVISDYGKLADLQVELEEKNMLLLEKYERYDYLSELRD